MEIAECVHAFRLITLELIHKKETHNSISFKNTRQLSKCNVLSRSLSYLKDT